MVTYKTDIIQNCVSLDLLMVQFKTNLNTLVYLVLEFHDFTNMKIVSIFSNINKSLPNRVVITILILETKLIFNICLKSMFLL